MQIKISAKHISYYVKLLKIKVKMKTLNLLWIDSIGHYVEITDSDVERLLDDNSIALDNISESEYSRLFNLVEK